MRDFRHLWLLGLIMTASIVIVPIALMVFSEPEPVPSPRDFLPQRSEPTDHSSLINGEFTTGSDVTRTCLTCHEDAADQVMHTTHWTWLSEPQYDETRGEYVQVGKANSINNFCIGIQSNWTGCTRCHTGYGWDSADFDFTNDENVDCLACHDNTGTYVKAAAGEVAAGVDLLNVARSVGTPTRQNCGSCHFNGGGGNAVKHGDLSEALYFPPESVDVHMGQYDMLCVDCHQTENHDIAGRALSVNVNTTDNQVACTDCHDTNLHEDTRIADHLDTVACQTCHIPTTATRDETKVSWDWSQAGDPNREESTHEYLRIKGEFLYEGNIVPDYMWFNGTLERYLLGDPINPDETTHINYPRGNIGQSNALIYPFRVHNALQPYDAVYDTLLQPQTAGEGGYWTTFDWDSALANGAEAAGLDYSGQYGFAPTDMYWVQSHLVVPSEQALTCTDCHGESGRMDWIALGYPGDPMTWGGRDTSASPEEPLPMSTLDTAGAAAFIASGGEG